MDAKEWDARYVDAEALWGLEPNVFVARHTADLAPGRAIDVAAGEGRNALWLASRGWAVTAVDFSPVALARAAERAGEAGLAVDLVEADVLTWEPGAPVDLVVIAYLQLPAEPRQAALARAAGWVAPGGRLVLVAHDRSNVAHGHGGPSSEAVCYDLDEAVALLEGFEVEVAEVARRPVPGGAGERERVALDTLVVARRPAG